MEEKLDHLEKGRHQEDRCCVYDFKRMVNDVGSSGPRGVLQQSDFERVVWFLLVFPLGVACSCHHSSGSICVCVSRTRWFFFVVVSWSLPPRRSDARRKVAR